MGALIGDPELHPRGGNPISQGFVEGSMSELSLESTQDFARPTWGLRRRGGKEDRGHKAIKMNGGDEAPDVRHYVSWVWLVQFSSVAQSCLTLCHPMDCSTPDLPVHHQLPEPAQTHVHRVGDAIQPSHPHHMAGL